MADAIAIIMLKEESMELAILVGRMLGPLELAHRVTEVEHNARFLVARAPLDDPGPHLDGDAPSL